MAGILSEGIKFYYGTSGSSTTSWTEVKNLMEIPSLGSTPEKVDVTTLGDSCRKYINGIKDYGDLSFKFLYDNSTANSNYRQLKGIENTVKSFKVELSDGSTFIFDGMCSADLDGAGVNAALTFTAQISLQSDIAVTNPTS